MPGALRAVRLASFAIPCLTLLVFFQGAFYAWFFMDDFAWLGLPGQTRDFKSFVDSLFWPLAQGTVRFLSERLYFLSLASIFDFESLPFRIVTFATQCVGLVMLNRLTKKLTGSAIAGFAAAMLWAVFPWLGVPLSWASAYNQILCAALMLSAFWFLVRYLESGARKHALAMWICYLAGFGALESMVVFPALAGLYIWMKSRRDLARFAAMLWIPALAFTAIHQFAIPRTASTAYAMKFDAGMLRGLGRYTWLAIGPTQLERFLGPDWTPAGMAAAALAALLLTAFLLASARAKRWLPAFFGAWFVVWLAPVLPLQNHISEYYLVGPATGLAMLAGYGIARAWNAKHIAIRAATALAVCAYAGGAWIQATGITDWYAEHSNRVRDVILAVDSAHKDRKMHTVLLAGVDTDLFQGGFQDIPFRLWGVPRVYLIPGSESAIRTREELRALDLYRTTLDDVVDLLHTRQAAVLTVTNAGILDSTERYRTIALDQYVQAGTPRWIDAGSPEFAAQFLSGWHNIEQNFRWMSQKASVRLGGRRSKQDKLYLTGFFPASIATGGPLRLDASVNRQKLGSVTISEAGQPFEVSYTLPESLIGEKSLLVEISTDRVSHLPGDKRDLGIIFGTVSVRP